MDITPEILKWIHEVKFRGPHRDDLYQEGVIRVLMTTYDPARSDVKTFVQMTTRWAARDYLRKHRSRSVELCDSDVRGVEESHHHLSCEELLAKYPEPKRSIYRLRGEGWTFPEIAAELKMSESNLWYHLRVRHKVKTISLAGWEEADLTPALRQVCKMLSDGMTYQEVADRIGRSIDYVYTAKSKAHARIQVSRKVDEAT